MTLLQCGRDIADTILCCFSVFLFNQTTKKKAALRSGATEDPKRSVKENTSFGNSFGTLLIALHPRSASVEWKAPLYKIRRQVLDASCAPQGVQNDLLPDLKQKKISK